MLVCSFIGGETNAVLLRGLREVKEWYVDVSWVVERWSYRTLTAISNFIGFLVRAAAMVSFALVVAWVLRKAEDGGRWRG